MRYAAVPWNTRRRRGMEQERTHQQCSPDADCAHHLRCVAHRRDVFLGYAAVQMGAWDDVQRPVLLTAVVKVQPHRTMCSSTSGGGWT